jgi:hypothetical protein
MPDGMHDLDGLPLAHSHIAVLLIIPDIVDSPIYIFHLTIIPIGNLVQHLIVIVSKQSKRLVQLDSSDTEKS